MKKAAVDLQRVCATGVNLRSEDVGCLCAPPFDACPPISGGALTIQDKVYPFYTRIEGAFTGPQKREVALFGGCDPPQSHCRGVVLVDLSTGTNEARRRPDFRPDVEASECVTFRTPQGNDRLVCKALQNPNSERNQEIFAYDFANDAAPRAPIYTARDNTRTACFDPLATSIVEQRVVDLSTRDTNGDGIHDVEITVAARKGKVTAAYNENCECTMRKRQKPCPSSRALSDFLSPTVQQKLTFLGTSDGAFAPTPATAKAIRTQL